MLDYAPDLRLHSRFVIEQVIQPTPDTQTFTQHLGIGIGGDGGHQIERRAHRLIARIGQRHIVVQQPILIDRGQAGKVFGQRSELRRGIERAIISRLPGVDKHGATAGHGHGRRRTLRHGVHCLPTDGCGQHRYVPALRLGQHGIPAIGGKLALSQRDGGVACLALRGGDLDQWHTRLQGELVGDLRQIGCARRLNGIPQIVCPRILILMRFHIILHALAPDIRARIGFQHRDDRLAFGIGDRIERLIGLLDRPDRLHDRVGGGIAVQPHGGFPRAHTVDIRAPFRVQSGRRLILHPAGEPFVQPEIVPPGHGDEIAEPLMRHFMRGDREDALAIAFGTDAWIVQQDALEGEDRAPVFHRAEKLGLPRPGNIIELRQWIRRAEIVVEEGQDGRCAVERILPLIGFALAHDDADIGPSHLAVDPFKIAQAEEQQIAGHDRRTAKGDAAQAIADIFARFHRHVAERHLVRRNGGGQIEHGLVIRLVPARYKPARIGRFELGEQPAALGPVRVLIVQREQSVRLRADFSGVDDVEQIGALGHALAKIKARGLRIGIQGDLGRVRFAVRSVQRHAVHREIRGVEHEGIGRLHDIERNPHRSAKGQGLRIGHDINGITMRHGGARKLRGQAGVDHVLLRCRLGIGCHALSGLRRRWHGRARCNEGERGRGGKKPTERKGYGHGTESSGLGVVRADYARPQAPSSDLAVAAIAFVEKNQSCVEGKKYSATSLAIRVGRRVSASRQHQLDFTSASTSSPRVITVS